VDVHANNITAFAAYLNVFLNPLIYILHYDVIRSSLVNLKRKIAAKFKTPQ